MNEPLNKIIFIYIKFLKYLWVLDVFFCQRINLYFTK